jgi:hypothetical protein
MDMLKQLINLRYKNLRKHEEEKRMIIFEYYILNIKLVIIIFIFI